ncbi:hypothetical protein [Cohnella panacarvi]|uniref:hypothetical protein n=1 Tax=Cohnella panacarvi TaxID=400776 RepID=UPI00047DF85E|nr:hypothetical protein [Cohnella panacarvi]
MENEVSDGVKITFNLVVIAAIIAIVVGFSVFTQEFKRNQVNAIADSQLENVSAELREVESYGAVPVPTLYAILRRSDGAAYLKPVTIYKTAVSHTEDLAAPKLLGKKVTIELTPVWDRFEVAIAEEKETEE